MIFASCIIFTDSHIPSRCLGRRPQRPGSARHCAFPKQAPANTGRKKNSVGRPDAVATIARWIVCVLHISAGFQYMHSQPTHFGMMRARGGLVLYQK